jgi:hypothetical protein
LEEEIKLGDAAQKSINQMNKKAALAVMSSFKRALSTASEPFFRKGLGERYFTSESHDGGMQVWFVGTIASGVIAWMGMGTIAGRLAELIGLPTTAKSLNEWGVPAITGILFITYYSQLCQENAKYLQQFRKQGTPYHSMSRGTVRWNEKNVYLFVAIIAGLLLFNIGVFVLFWIAVGLAKKIANEQEAVIYSRYLDAIDERLENKFMKEALLGRTEPGQTYLARPLSEKKYIPEVREQIADAWTRGSMVIVAKPRRSGQPAVAKNNPSPSSPVTKGREGESSPVPDAGSTSKAKKDEPEPAAAALSPAPVVKAAAPAKPTAPRVNPKIYLGIMVLLFVTIAAGAIVYLWPAKHTEQPALAARPVVNTPPPQERALPLKPQPVAAVTQSPPAAPTNPQPTAVVTSSKPVDSASSPTEDPESQKRNHFIQEANETLDAQFALLAKFKTDCQSHMDGNVLQIAKAPSSDRTELWRRYDNDRQMLRTIMTNQTQLFGTYRDLLIKCTTNQSLDVQTLVQPLNGAIDRTEAARQMLLSNLTNLDDDLDKSQAPH